MTEVTKRVTVCDFCDEVISGSMHSVGHYDYHPSCLYEALDNVVAARKNQSSTEGVPEESRSAAQLYFDTLRAMNPSPELLAAIERVEAASTEGGK
jgi:hypothetical protein